MNSPKAIGGYFELELPSPVFGKEYKQATLLNSGRSAFECVLRAGGARKIYLPKFTCDVMLEPLTRLNISYAFYAINERLEMTEHVELAKNEYVVFTNYFGIKEAYAAELEKKYGAQLIYDCSQAFYARPLQKAATFYSPRKFFGLPDGGILYYGKHLSTPLLPSESYDHFTHLIRRIDGGPEAGYEEFKKNDALLSKAGVRAMSPSTERLLATIDIESARKIRNKNFSILHKALNQKNSMSPLLQSINGALCYPFMATSKLRRKLINNHIFVATYWPNVSEWAEPEELEFQLTQNLLPLPIDQRYGPSDMQRILDAINE